MPETPRRIAVPPAYLLATLIAMIALHYLLPIANVIPSPVHYVGVLPILAGIGMAGWGVRAFDKAGTPVRPFEPSTELVTRGLYRYTRNPMYLGMVLLLLGVAVLLGSVTPLLPVPLFVWFIQRNFIRGEEGFLEGIFGERYRQYKKTVRRWI